MKFVKATSIAVVIFCTITSFFFLENEGAIEPVFDNTNNTLAFENDKASGEYLNPRFNRKRALFDTIPFRFLPKEEQYKRAEPYHVYGDLKLKMRNPFNYYYRDKESGFEVRESFPGVLNYFYQEKKPYSGFKLEFYNEEKQLVKTIDLEKETPYNEHNFPGIGQGYPNMEYYERREGFDPKYRESADNFSTVNEMLTRPNGFTIVEYQLIPTLGSNIIGWEETLVVYDQQGNELSSITFPLYVGDTWVSGDGRFLAFIAAFPNENQGQFFRIYDLKTLDMIYEQKALPEQKFRGLMEIDNEFLRLGNLYKRGSERIEYFFDFKNRIRYSKHLVGEERKKAFENFTTYSKIFGKVSFDVEKF